MSFCPVVEEIVTDFMYETQSDDGSKVLHVYALDGRILWITTPTPAKLKRLQDAERILRASDETLQRRNRRNPTETGQHPSFGPGKSSVESLRFLGCKVSVDG